MGYPEEEDMSLYEGPSSRRVRCPPQVPPYSRDRSLLKGLGDRLRREAMIRSQMAAAMDPGLIPPRTHPVSQVKQTLRPSLGHEVEIDVDYGTDEEVGMEQMCSEWWVEGAPMEHGRPAHHRGMKADPPVNVAAGQLPWVCCPTPSSSL